MAIINVVFNPNQEIASIIFDGLIKDAAKNNNNVNLPTNSGYYIASKEFINEEVNIFLSEMVSNISCHLGIYNFEEEEAVVYEISAFPIKQDNKETKKDAILKRIKDNN